MPPTSPRRSAYRSSTWSRLPPGRSRAGRSAGDASACSPPPRCLQLGLYERAFEAFGIETRYPDDQAEIMAIIKAVKKEGATAGLRSRFNVVARRLIAGDVDFLVIACTELSLLVDGLDADLAKIDALDVLVATIVERTLPHGR
ncbi:aspartate/glutamate racemase family protein [Mesorhizobium sp. WSM4904]|uniref:aspartate/glutamate racemase family protein n=1 Tax=Mesorhizobium sp. WSM4904 TaxID=3038545 RepID=UPI00241874EE|nr:aspartate/glutamate racemase family protein [Mesorhizobium sp. WSM4904]WFP65499.1 aspartate/glutamate racemase family protein [Mesorhizobium sp. WSM4904]